MSFIYDRDMKYLLFLLAPALLLVGCTVQQSNDRIDQATFRTKQAVDVAGGGAKKAAAVTIEAGGSAAAGVSGAVDSVKETTGPLMDNAMEGVGSAIESVKEVAK